MSITNAITLLNRMTTPELVSFLVEEVGLENPDMELARKIGSILSNRNISK